VWSVALMKLPRPCFIFCCVLHQSISTYFFIYLTCHIQENVQWNHISLLHCCVLHRCIVYFYSQFTSLQWAVQGWKYSVQCTAVACWKYSVQQCGLLKVQLMKSQRFKAMFSCVHSSFMVAFQLCILSSLVMLWIDLMTCQYFSSSFNAVVLLFWMHS
jgi:hypothetical protein